MEENSTGHLGGVIQIQREEREKMWVIVSSRGLSFSHWWCRRSESVSRRRKTTRLGLAGENGFGGKLVP